MRSLRQGTVSRYAKALFFDTAIDGGENSPGVRLGQRLQRFLQMGRQQELLSVNRPAGGGRGSEPALRGVAIRKRSQVYMPELAEYSRSAGALRLASGIALQMGLQ